MNLKPASIEELSEALACVNTRGEKVTSIDLTRMTRLLEHKAEDMTATVEAGISLAAFQTEVAKHGQWLPIDPPNPETLAIGDCVSTNVSSPRRFGYGTIGDYVIGLKAVLADGRVIQSGGKVVKNVAGYDIAKLFIGAHGSLGVVVEVTFKLRPLPEVERYVEQQCKSLDQADALIASVLNSDLTPVVLDLHHLTGGPLTTVIGFAGTQEEVEWQVAKAAELGFTSPSSLQYEAQFWQERIAQKESVLPSKICEALKTVGTPFVARAGNGIFYHRGARIHRTELPTKLIQRVKDEFDPKHILPELPL